MVTFMEKIADTSFVCTTNFKKFSFSKYIIKIIFYYYYGQYFEVQKLCRNVINNIIKYVKKWRISN